MKYAVEVAKFGSLNKASEVLLIAQPNLSRSIKELEGELGIVIFDRTSRGMTLTPEGEEFISYAKGILSQIEQVENIIGITLFENRNSPYLFRVLAIFRKHLPNFQNRLQPILRKYSIRKPILKARFEIFSKITSVWVLLDMQRIMINISKTFLKKKDCAVSWLRNFSIIY